MVALDQAAPRRDRPHRRRAADRRDLAAGPGRAGLDAPTPGHRRRRWRRSRSPSPADVDRAVRAARRAFDEGPWPRARATERIRVLRRVADLVREHGDELLALQALDNSVPLSFGAVYAISTGLRGRRVRPSRRLGRQAGRRDAAAVPGRRPPGDDAARAGRRGRRGRSRGTRRCCWPRRSSRRPWRPAARSCSSRRSTPRSRCSGWSGLIEEAGLPPGVLNVVTGPGEPDRRRADQPPDGGQDLVHRQPGRGPPDHDAAASTFKRVSLELGGKSPALVFADADVGTAAAITMGTVTLGLSGQVCLAQTRALVHRDVDDEFLGHGRDDRRDGQLRQPVRPGGHRRRR